jgi:lipoprotein-releasing system ATP-binding protein
MKTELKNVIQAVEVVKYFYDPVKQMALKNINLSIKEKEFVSIVGKSGCGKSTLLYLLSTMDTDYEGDILVENEALKGKSEKDLARIRNKKIGFVFQFHYLLNEFSVLENVMLPALKLNELPQELIREKACKHLSDLGLIKLLDKKASQISGGEKQRVAIARALINDPLIIMGDEPTGNLDSKNTELVFDIFKHISSVMGQSLLIVTHDNKFAQNTHRTIVMDDGMIVS